jgi:transposase-like protein
MENKGKRFFKEKLYFDAVALALEKLVYLAYRNIRKKWTMPLANWGQTAILYTPDRQLVMRTDRWIDEMFGKTVDF